MRLHSRKSGGHVVRSVQDENRSRLPWGKVVYGIILLAAVFLLGRYVVINTVYYSARGLVACPKTDVTAPSAVRVGNLTVELNDPVERGQELAAVTDTSSQFSLGRFLLQRRTETFEAGRELAEARRDKKLVEQELTSVQQQIERLNNKVKEVKAIQTALQNGARPEDWPDQPPYPPAKHAWQVIKSATRSARAGEELKARQQQLKHLRTKHRELRELVQGNAATRAELAESESEVKQAEHRVTLGRLEKKLAERELAAKRRALREELDRRLKNLKRDRDHARAQVQRLQTRLHCAEQRVESWRQQQSTVKASPQPLQSSLRELAASRTLKAPHRGVVTAIHVRPTEVAPTAAPILTVARPEKAYIKAYFPQKARARLTTGTKVTVRVPHGQNRSGRVRRVYPTTRHLPAAHQEQFQKGETFLVAEITSRNGDISDLTVGSKVTVRLPHSWLPL